MDMAKTQLLTPPTFLLHDFIYSTSVLLVAPAKDLGVIPLSSLCLAPYIHSLSHPWELSLPQTSPYLSISPSTWSSSLSSCFKHCRSLIYYLHGCPYTASTLQPENIPITPVIKILWWFPMALGIKCKLHPWFKKILQNLLVPFCALTIKSQPWAN